MLVVGGGEGAGVLGGVDEVVERLEVVLLLVTEAVGPAFELVLPDEPQPTSRPATTVTAETYRIPSPPPFGPSIPPHSLPEVMAARRAEPAWRSSLP